MNALLEAGIEEVPDADMEIKTADTLPPIVDAAGFLAEKIDLPRELVYGILHKGSKMVLGGGSKTFKTWTLMDLAVAVAAGEPWLSFKTARGRVLYINFEIQAGFFQQRLQAVAKEKHVTLTTGQIEIWNLRGYAASYDLLLPKISERVKDSDYSLIVLDPVYKLYGNTDENSAGAVARLLNAIEGLAVDSGAAIAFGAHYSKGNQAGKEAIDRISGSGVFARDPDTILNFTRHEEEDAFTVEATLRNFKSIEPLVVRWLYPLMRRDESLDPSRLKKPAGRKPEHDPEELLQALPGSGLSLKDWQGAASEQCGVSGTTFHRLRRALEKRGKVLKDNTTHKWQPTKTKQ